MPGINRPLPLFCTGFTQLRRLNAVYVDKTALFPELCQISAMIFLARPRRFGKTLLVSTFESLFRNGLRDFSGLALEKEWSDRTYPVIRLDFSMAKSFDSMASFEARLEILFSRALREAGFDVPGGQSACERFFTVLSQSDTSSIVLLIDEYDAPLTSHLDDPKLFEQAQQRLSQFYADVKFYGSRLRFLFMTGITKLSNTGIFSGFNNLMDISLHPRYGALLGYTEAEIRENFAPYIARAAQALDCSTEDIMTQLRLHYNGYCFDKTATQRVHCPWSVLKFFNDPSLGFESYW